VKYEISHCGCDYYHTNVQEMVKSTKRGYKEGRPKRDDNEEDSDNETSRRNDKDYNDLRDDDEDEEDEEEYEDKEYDKANIKRRKEEVRPIGKSKGDEDAYWAKKIDQTRDLLEEYKKDNILLRAELRAARGSLETTKRKMRVELGWDGEEANLSENVANYCRRYFFPHSSRTSGTSLTQNNQIACQILLKNRLKSLSVQTTVIYGKG
jgi:hypothetical protein